MLVSSIGYFEVSTKPVRQKNNNKSVNTLNVFGKFGELSKEPAIKRNVFVRLVNYVKNFSKTNATAKKDSLNLIS